jgi:hypothetical protein
VNLPSTPEVPGIDLVRPGRRVYRRGTIRPVDGSIEGNGLVFRVYAEQDAPPHEDAPGTDFAAISAGRIAVGLLQREWDASADADERAWFAELVASSGTPR